MSKMNSAHLSPLVVNYQSNGSGRDSYIKTNCGGLIDPKQRATQFSIGTFGDKQRYRSINNFLPAKHVHYHSDGTGRDKYIIINEGGLVGDLKKPNYIGNLREYPKFSTPRSNDFLTNSQFLPTLSQAIKQGNLFKSQTRNSERLSQPRNSLDPYEVDKRSSPLPGLRRIY